jgi:hypothetical protein
LLSGSVVWPGCILDTKKLRVTLPVRGREIRAETQSEVRLKRVIGFFDKYTLFTSQCENPSGR